MKKITRIITLVLIVAAAVAGIAWRLSDNKAQIAAEAEAAQVRNPTVLVTVARPEMRAIEDELSQTGSLKPIKEVALVAETSGRLVQLNFENGTQVSAGKVLAVVDNSLLRQQLDLAKLNLEKTERDVTRLANLAAEGGVSQQQLDDARNQAENLKAQIKNLETQLSHTYVKAPFAGTITNKQVEQGSFVSPPAKLADLVATGKLLMQVYVLEDQVVRVKNGQTAQVTIDLFSDKPLRGRVTFIDVKADPSQRYLVEVEVPNPGNLRAGMNGRVLFAQEAPKPVLTLPRQVFVGSLRDGKVYVVENNKAVLRTVRIGKVSDEYVEITGGLTEQDSIVLTGQINLNDGAPVSVN